MAWRETRATWLRLVFFFLCVGLGVAAIVVLRSIVQEVRSALTREARALVAADVVVQSSRPFAEDLRLRLDGIATAGGAVASANLVETQTMAAAEREDGDVRLVELRGVEASHPFYGELELEGGQPYSHALLRNRGAIVQPELLSALDIEVGGTFRLAGETFVVRGIIARDGMQRRLVAFGPRVYIDLEALQATSLLGFGSRATYQILYRLADPTETRSLVSTLRENTRDDMLSIRSWQTLENAIGRNLERAENYLSLVGFAIVVIGGIGVWSVTRVLVQQKIRSIAVLKCLGASGASVLAVSLVQVAGLAVMGSIVGLGLAAGALMAVPASVLEPLGTSSVPMTFSAAMQGVAVGVVVSMLFALVPLLDIRRVKPLVLLRAQTAGDGKLDRAGWLAAVGVGLLLTAVAGWQADSARTGLYVAGGALLVGVLLYAGSAGLVRLTRPLLASSRFVLRHASVSLGRPGNQTRIILMSVGLGCFFILGVRSVQMSLLADLGGEMTDRAPDFVLIDIQRDQIDSLQRVVAPFLREPARIVPNMRARVVGVDGGLQLDSVQAVREHRRLTREYGLTFRDRLEANEEIVRGAFWGSDEEGGVRSSESSGDVDTEVSIELDAEEDGVSIGDVIRFDAAGVILRALVTSVRRVAWDNAQSGGFIFVLKPTEAVLAAPHTYVGFLQVRDQQAATRGDLQRALVRSHPNVTAIDVRDIIASIRRVTDNVTAGVTAVGIVTLAGGILILIGAVAMTKFQRIYEAAIYRTLGASSRQVALMLVVEYGLLGALAGALGAIGGAALSWLLVRHLFQTSWTPAPALWVAGIVGSAAVVALVGVLASLDVLRRKPLATLRSE